MKKLLLSSIFTLTAISISFAQLEFGAGASLITRGTTIGLQGKVGMDITDQIDGMATLSYYFPGDGASLLSIDADAHYELLTLGDDISLSALAGLNYARSNSDIPGVSGSSSDIGLNVGAHFRIPVNNMMIYAEPKFIIGDGSSLIIAGGIMF